MEKGPQPQPRPSKYCFGTQKPSIRKVLLLGLLACCLACSGCSAITSSPEISFSPDGSMIAYTCAWLWQLPTPPEVYTIRSTAYVRWCLIDRPKERHSVKIDSFGAKHGFWIASQVHPAFSPDARHLVAANPRNLVIIGVDDGKARPLTRPGEFVTGFAWLGSEEIGYVAHSNRRGKYQEITDRTFWRQRIHEPLEARREVFRQIGFDGCPKDGIGSLDWPLEHWSPCGRYTVFMSQRNDGQFQLLDVNSGNVRAFGRSGVDSEGISWKPDGSAVIIVNRKRSESFQALLLHPTTGEIVDLSEQFNESFGKGSQHSAPKLAPLWTPDGQYLLANHLEVGGCVVRPSPWEVIPVGRQVLEHVRRTDARTLFPSASDRLPWAFRQPAAPWVRVWVQFEVEGRPHGEDYAVNYETGAIVPLGASDSPGGGWTITPDAKRAARFDRWDILVIRPVNLPHGAGG